MNHLKHAFLPCDEHDEMSLAVTIMWHNKTDYLSTGETPIPNSIKQDPWETDSHLAALEIPPHVQTQNLQSKFSIHKRPNWNLSWTRLNQPTPSRLHVNIFLFSMPRSSKISLTFRYSDYNSVCFAHLVHFCYVSCQSGNIWYNHPTNILSPP